MWTPPEFEIKKLEKAYLKFFKPTIDYINKISGGGYYNTKLTYIDLEGKNHNTKFEITLISDNEPGLKFKILLPNVLNIGSVKYKESYGLAEELILENKDTTLIIPENSVIEFNTKIPAKPQILEGRFKRVKTSKDYKNNSYCRLIIPTKDNDMIYPTTILEYKENHMKFDMPNWDRQTTIMGIPFMTTKGMYVELTIKNWNFHFYGLEQINSLIIDSIEEISVKKFREVAYAIRLCFAFLIGRFYKDETILVASSNGDFSKIDYLDYCLEEASILTDNQIINPTLFFSQSSEKDEETQTLWKPFHNMFDTRVLSSMCDKVLDSSEFMRSLELIVNAGNIIDPVQKGALYSVCIETLTEIIKTKNEIAFKPIENKKIWKPFYNDLKSCLDKIKGEISDEGLNILNAKISNLNSPTNRDKLEKPFKLVGIELSQNEIESLEQRNNYLHGGQPNDDGWFTKSNLNALKIHYLIGMLILKYFKYSGHYINLSGWYLLHDNETENILKNFDFSELGEVMRKIKDKDFESIEQLDSAKKKMKNFDKFNKASLEIEDLIRII